jgi:serine/threonine-protein kinase
VSDFGLAKKVNPLTLLATAAGTLGFKPPETFSKTKADSCAGDVWALGVTLYLMLTDRLPFEVDPDLGWSNKKAFEKEFVSPGSLNVEVDAGLEKIILRCLEMDPAKRYQTAKDLLDALGMWKIPTPSKETCPKKAISSEGSKSGLGAYSPIDQEEGQHLARLAMKKAKDEGRLFEAADIMEEAFNKSPSLRQKYANQVRLWRCGISM